MALSGYAAFPGRLIPVGVTASAIENLRADAILEGNAALAAACALVLAGADDEATKVARERVHACWT